MNKKIFKIDLNAAILKTLMLEPEKSYKAVAEQYGVGLSSVNDIAKKNGISRKSGPKAKSL
jgi:hypothetical protein